MVQGYCLKERKKVDIKDPEYSLNKKGRPVVKGKCASCGTTVYKILAAADAPAELRAKIKKGGRSKASRKSKKSKGSRKSKRSHRSRK
jgi:hypothetical protein